LENFVRGAADGALKSVADYEKARSEKWRDQPWTIKKEDDDRASTKSRFAVAIQKKIIWFTKRIAQVHSINHTVATFILLSTYIQFAAMHPCMQ
jgi:hypothetical protein